MSKITDLTALTGANSATGDLFEIVDISDTTMAATGTNKKMTRDELRRAITPAPEANALTGSPALKFWYKADDLSGSDGSAVTAWADASSSAYDLSQGTGSKQPILKLNVPHFNGRKAVRFDGTDDTLTDLSTGSSSVSTWTAFAVCYSTSTATKYVFDARGTNFCDVFFESATWRFRAVSAVAQSGTTEPAIGTVVVIGVYDGAILTLWVNGRPAAYTTTTGTFTPTNIYIGSNADSNGFWAGDLAEVGLFSTALSTSQLIELNNGLSNKYGTRGLIGV